MELTFLSPTGRPFKRSLLFFFCLFTYLSSLPVSAQIDVSKAVGATKGNTGVSSSGGATCSIPIEIPNGTNGVQPELSLVYNSQSGAGLAGNGWNITGISSISRAGKTDYYNGITTPVTYTNANDAFCLNGMRMFTITGTNGSDGTVYGAENESYAKIESFGGSAAQGPAWFRVTSKDGTIMEFGNTTDSRLMTTAATPSIMAWYVNKVTDRNGNYILYKYVNGNNIPSSVLISEITYTGNTATGLTPYNKVLFLYGSRIDPVTTYDGGYPSTSPHRLEGLSITSNGGLYKSYKMTYASVQNQTYLQNIAETGKDATTTYNPIKFEYGNNAATEDVRILPPFTFLPTGDCITGDFDGDGKTDILTARYTYDNAGYKSHNKYEIFSDFNGFGSTGSVSYLVNYTLPTTGTEVMGVKQNTYYNFMAQDYDNDGKDDVMLTQYTVEGSGSTAKRVFSKIIINHTRTYNVTSGWTSYTKNFDQVPTITGYAASKYIHKSGNFCLQGDFDGDGNQDYILLLGVASDASFAAFLSCPAKNIINNQIVNFGIGTNTGTFFATTVANADNIIPVDFDGDGKTELLVTKDATSYILSVSPVSAASGYNYGASILYTTTAIAKGYRVFPADFNGDGKTDLLVRNSAATSSGTWSVLISTGKEFVTGTNVPFANAPILSGDNGYTVAHTLTVGDFNGDGKSDILHCLDLSASSSRYNICYSTGNGFIAETYTKPLSINSNSNVSGDLNGDGKTDCVNLKGETGQIVSLKPMYTERLLSKVTNGIGAVTTFTYGQLTNVNNNTIYYRSAPYYYADPNEITTGNYLYSKPYQTIQSPIYVVGDMTTPDGIGGTTINRYTYEDAMFSRANRGFLGFKKVTSTNSSTGVTTATYQDVNTSFFVPYLVKQTTTVNGKVLSEVTPANSFTSLSTGFFDKRFVVKADKMLSVDYLNGQANESSNTFDNYGNVTTNVIKQGYLSGTTVTPIETITTTTTYGAYSTPVPAFPLQLVVNRVRQGAPAVTETLTNTYTTTGQLATHVDFSGKAKAVTTTNTYDAYGNPTQTIMSAAGLASRIEKSTFDNQGRFVTKRESSGGDVVRTETYTYDNVAGVPLTEVSMEGLTTTFAYDAFHQLIKTTVPEGFDITNTLKWETADGIYSFTKEQPGGGSNVKIWYDILGREVKRQESGFGNNWLTTTLKYDARGNIVTQVSPYYSSETPVSYTNTYDSYNRLTGTSGTAGSTTYVYETLTGGQQKVTATSSGGKSSIKITDAANKIISVTDGGGQITYTYNSWGKRLSTNHGSFQLVSSTFDEYGRQTLQSDMNAGNTTYEYNAFGQLTKQINNGNTYTLTYDGIGRISTSVAPEGTTTYEYFKTPTGGFSNNKPTKITGPNGVIETYEYDNLRRLKTAKKTIDGTDYSFAYEYDAYGNPSKTTFPSGLIVNHAHDRNGLTTSTSLASGATLFNGTAMNSMGMYTTYTLGNGKTSQSTYDLPSGTPKRFYTAGIQDLNYTFEAGTGNLLSRNDAINGLTEAFTYDNMGRLLTTKVNGTQQLAMTYDNSGGISMGNIATKTDAGNYKYNDNRVHAVNYITNPAGATTPPSVIPIAQQDITYTSFRKSATVTENGYKMNITYGPDEERVKSELLLNGTTQEKRYYLGNYDKQIIGTTTRELHYVNIANGEIAIIVRTNGVDKVYYAYVDHLRSIVTITDDAGTILAKQNFDAWGRRRNPDTWQYANVPARPEWLYLGYTGHEHLDKFSLINMSGRMYDPTLGRMTSADNLMPLAYNSQGLNRYSYANNNPLIFVDKDGNFIQIIVAAIIGGVVNVAANWGDIGSFGEGLSYFGVGALSGAVTSVAGPWAGGAVMGLGNSLTTQISAGGIGSVNIESTLIATGYGALISGVSAGIGNAIAPSVSGALSKIASPVIKQAVIQATVGAGVGFGIGAVSSMATGGSMSDVLSSGAKGAAFGFASGVINGTVSGFAEAAETNRNPWTGKSTLKVELSPIESVRATLPDVSADLSNTPSDNEYVTVRHHTDAAGAKGIKASMQITASRGEPYGVDIEIEPFKAPSKVNVGQKGKGSYIEFTVPKSAVGPPAPGYLGGNGNAGRIVTGGAPFKLQGTNPKIVNWDWWKWLMH